MSYYAYMSDEAPETFTVTLAGRQVLFRRPKLGQILILQRSAQKMMTLAQADPEDQGKALTSAMVKTLDFVETLIVEEADRQFVEDQMLAGTIDYQDMLHAMSGGKPEDVADDQAPKPVRKAPKKSPKAAAAATSEVAAVRATAKGPVASRGRTKR